MYRQKAGSYIYAGVFVLMGVVWLLPIFFQVMTSFKSIEETYLAVQTVFPQKWTI